MSTSKKSTRYIDSITRNAPGHTPLTERYIWYVVGLLTIVNIVNYADRMALSILLPAIKNDLSLSDTQLGLLTGIAFALFYASFGLPIARWADHGNRRNIVSYALVVWSLATSAGGAAQNFLHLFIARMAIGVGEAGCIPPSQSIISDYVPKSRRTGALSMQTSGAFFGMAIGLMVGGWLSVQFGWRITFLLLGLPGLVLAVIVRFTLRAPARGLSDGVLSSGKPPPLAATLSRLFKTRTYVNVVLIYAITSIANVGLAQWLPSFYVRVHDMNIADVGVAFGMAIGIGSAIGTLSGGFLSNPLTRIDIRSPLLLCALAQIVTIPIGLSMLLIGSAKVALILNFVFAITSSICAGILITTIHNVVPPRMRALAVAINMFFLSLIGFGGGPLLVGLLSDVLANDYGIFSLRYAMAAVLCLTMLTVINYVFAAKSLSRDLVA